MTQDAAQLMLLAASWEQPGWALMVAYAESCGGRSLQCTVLVFGVEMGMARG